MASPKAEPGYFDRKRKPCKYSIKKLKVTGVTSSHHPVILRTVVNKGFLDLIKFRGKIKRA